MRVVLHSQWVGATKGAHRDGKRPGRYGGQAPEYCSPLHVIDLHEGNDAGRATRECPKPQRGHLAECGLKHTLASLVQDGFLSMMLRRVSRHDVRFHPDDRKTLQHEGNISHSYNRAHV